MAVKRVVRNGFGDIERWSSYIHVSRITAFVLNVIHVCIYIKKKLEYL